MKSKIIIFLVIITLSCGSKINNKNPISKTNNIGHNKDITPTDVCSQLKRNLKIQFQLLNDSTEFFLKANNSIFSLLASSWIKNNKLCNCNLDDLPEFTYTRSHDNKLVLLSWDAKLGGSMTGYTTCAIFQTKGKYVVKWLNDFINNDNQNNSETDFACFYKIYDIKTKSGKTIYLAYGYGLAQALCPWFTIKAYEVSSELEEVAVFPGNKPQLFCEYDLVNLNENNQTDSIFEIQFSNNAIKIAIPIIKHGRATEKYKTLSFDGDKYIPN